MMMMDRIPPEPEVVEELRAIYREHRRPLGEECSCGEPNCMKGATARNRLWWAGINPEPNR